MLETFGAIRNMISHERFARTEFLSIPSAAVIGKPYAIGFYVPYWPRSTFRGTLPAT